MTRLVLAFGSTLLTIGTGLGLGAGCSGGDPARAPGMTFDACAPLAIVVGASLTAEQSQGVAGGLAMWNRLAATELASSSDDPSQPSPTAAATPRVPLVFQPAAPPFHGFFDDQAGVVFINEGMTAIDPLRITIAHELGHVFGLPHVDPALRTSLMNSGNTTVEATPEDADALAALWGRCPP